MLIKNATIVNWNSTQENVDILIKDGIIINIDSEINIDDDTILIANKLHVFPGFIDLHCHLRDPGFTHKEDIVSGTYAAAAGGFTTVCSMPNTSPVADTQEVLEYIIKKAKNDGYAKVLPVACITKGMKGDELTDFESLKSAVAFSDDGLPVLKENLLTNAFKNAAAVNKFLMLHEEDIKLRKDGEVNEGNNSKKAGLKGIPREVEDNFTQRDVLIAMKNDAPVHICHVSTKGSVEIIRQAKKQGAKITCETTPHYFSLDDSLILNYTPLLKVNPPIREKSDVDAIIQGIKDGTIDAIATDHAPHTSEEKKATPSPFGMIGFETAFSLGYTNLVKKKKISLNKLIELMSKKPSDILNINEGEIKVGADANICICDLEQRYIYKEENILSKSKNSPFINYEMYGKMKYTISKGEIKYDYRQID